MKLGVNVPYFPNTKAAEESARWLFMKRLQPIYEKNKNIIPIMWMDFNGQGCGKTRNIINDILMNEVDYIIYIDSDDIIGEDYLEKVYEACEEGYDIIETKFSIKGNIVPFKEKLPNHVTGIAYKVDLIKDLRFNENRNIGEDTEYNTYINENKEFTRKFIDDVYYYDFGSNKKCLSYRFNSGEITEFKGGDKM